MYTSEEDYTKASEVNVIKWSRLLKNHKRKEKRGVFSDLLQPSVGSSSTLPWRTPNLKFRPLIQKRLGKASPFAGSFTIHFFFLFIQIHPWISQCISWMVRISENLLLSYFAAFISFHTVQIIIPGKMLWRWARKDLPLALIIHLRRNWLMCEMLEISGPSEMFMKWSQTFLVFLQLRKQWSGVSSSLLQIRHMDGISKSETVKTIVAGL